MQNSPRLILNSPANKWNDSENELQSRLRSNPEEDTEEDTEDIEDGDNDSGTIDAETANRANATPEMDDPGLGQRMQAERWRDFDAEEQEAAPRHRAGGAGAKARPGKGADKNTVRAKASGPRVIADGEEDGEYSGPLASFFADELIVGTPVVVKSGKEASVYCCQAHPRLQAVTGNALLAAKVYRAREHRSFKNYSVYQQGRTTMNTRLDKAIAQKSAKGLSAQFGLWIGAEYETLSRLHKAGADVPKPYAQAESALLLDYYGTAGMAAPQLVSVQPTRDEAARLFEQMRRNLAVCLECDRVHGDLSPYNILYWQGALRIIDFPQAVDPMDNPDAYALFVRDVANVCEWFALYGVVEEPRALAFSLWMQSGRARPRDA